jgi:hypothetical protein
MRYLIFTIINESGKREAFFTEWYDDEKFTPGIGMVVFDLVQHKMTTDGVLWDDIIEDHL